MKQYSGNTLLEYAIVLSLGAMRALMVLQFVGQSISGNLLSAVLKTGGGSQAGTSGTLDLLKLVSIQKGSDSSQVCLSEQRCIEPSPPDS